MKSLWFITPAFKRYALTEIILAERRWVCDSIKETYRVDASCVVIADDENLEIAEHYGFETVEYPNDYLSDKFQQGVLAAHRAGVDYIFPIGSDSFIDPVYFEKMPPLNSWGTGRAYNVIPPSGDRRGEMWIDWIGGVSMLVPVCTLAHRKFMPYESHLKCGCDTSLWHRGRLRTTKQKEMFAHQLEYVAFQSYEGQISKYERLMGHWGWQEVKGDPFKDLRAHYPKVYVDAVKKYSMAQNRR